MIDTEEQMTINPSPKPVILWLVDWGEDCLGPRYAICSSAGEEPWEVFSAIDRVADPSLVKFRPICTEGMEGEPWVYVELDDYIEGPDAFRTPKGNFQELSDWISETNQVTQWRTPKQYAEERKLKDAQVRE